MPREPSGHDALHEARYTRQYTREAATYDFDRFADHKGRLYSQHTSRLLADVLPRSSARTTQTSVVLDVATGTGRGALALDPRDGFVVGIDLAHAMLVQAQRKAHALGATRVHFSVATAVQLPFKDATFDTIICLRFFHFMPRRTWPWIVAEMRRVLKPNGALLLEFVNPFYGGVGALFRTLFRRPPIYLWPSQLRRLCAPAELKHVRTVGTYLPLVQLLGRLSPSAAHRVLRLSRLPLLCHLASEKWYVLVKR